MTTYFDTFEAKVAAVDAEGDDAPYALRELDAEFVRDVSLGAMWPGFPVDPDVVFGLIATYSLAGRPVNHIGGSPETTQEYKAALLRLSWELHTIWHEVGRCKGFYGDEPLAPITALLADAAERTAQAVGRLGLGPSPEEWRERWER